MSGRPKNDPVCVGPINCTGRYAAKQWLLYVRIHTKVYRQVRLAHFMGDEQKQTRIQHSAHSHAESNRGNAKHQKAMPPNVFGSTTINEQHWHTYEVIQ